MYSHPRNYGSGVVTPRIKTFSYTHTYLVGWVPIRFRVYGLNCDRYSCGGFWTGPMFYCSTPTHRACGGLARLTRTHLLVDRDMPAAEVYKVYWTPTSPRTYSTRFMVYLLLPSVCQTPSSAE